MVSLGDRMKQYEDAYRIMLPKRLPVILRLDGRAFHTLLRNAAKPYDVNVSKAMSSTMWYLMGEIQNAVFGYTQSDEISILLNNWKTIETESWFGNNLQKMVSISASIASRKFTEYYAEAEFDCRAFILPNQEVCNYFIWRQQDCTRNSINSLGQSLFSDRELHGKNTSEVQDMCMAAGKNWNDVATMFKRGICDTRGIDLDYEIPVFTQDRKYIERHLECTD